MTRGQVGRGDWGGAASSSSQRPPFLQLWGLTQWWPECVGLWCVLQLYVHLKEGGGPDGLDALKNKPQLHSMVARSLCRSAAGKNYIIFTGPSITSLTLFEEFEKQGLSPRGPASPTSSPGDGVEGLVKGADLRWGASVPLSTPPREAGPWCQSPGAGSGAPELTHRL